ncbi:MAG: transposase [Ignavibacteriaceae bacterium]
MAYKKYKQYRLPGYNYSEEGRYFVTICTKNRKEDFGKVISGKMVLSSLGQIADQKWKELPQIFKNISLDEHIIMPDHVHGIVIIKARNTPQRIPTDQPDISRKTPRRVPTEQPEIISKKTPRRVPTERQINYNSNLHPLIKGSVSSIINHFKGAVTKWCNNNGHKYFKWQTRFHDRIIRNDIEFYFAQEYIINNPLNYDRDKNLNEEDEIEMQIKQLKAD